MASLKLNHIYKVYPNGVKAVNDFTMDIEDKEFIVFVGPSGCGKSTTLRMIAGIEEITAGELYIGDNYVNYVAPKDRDIAMVFQNYALYPHMTVYDNMAFGLKLRKVPKKEIDKRVKEAANILGITEYLDRKPKAMSGGQRQRVALGRAIVREPKVFLLDEPLSNLDAKLRTQMRAEISKLHRRLQTTFIYVTHDQTEAMTMGTRIVVMKDGYVQQIDTPRNLYRYPCNKFVAGFIGTPQMNFFTGRLKRCGDTVNVTIDGTGFNIDVPAEYFVKVSKKYLNGETPVTIGLRPEHITTNLKEYPYTAKCRVTNVEELGVSCQVYADFNLDESDASVAESPTKVILHAPAGSLYLNGEVITVAVDLSEIQMFDAETGETLAPRIPAQSEICAEVSGGCLKIGESYLTLPPALNVRDGSYDLIIPNDAITVGKGAFPAEITAVENVNGIALAVLKIDGQTLFAASEGTEYSLGKTEFNIDLKKITLLQNGEQKASAVKLVNGLEGAIVKNEIKAVKIVRGKEKTVTEWEYKLKIGDYMFDCSENVVATVFSSLSEKICSKPLLFEFAFDKAVFTEQGLEVEVTKILDYGSEKYAVCNIGENEICVLLTQDIGLGKAYISLCSDDLSIYEPALGIKIK